MHYFRLSFWAVVFGGSVVLFSLSSCDVFDDRQQYTGVLVDGTEVFIPLGINSWAILRGYPEFSRDGQSIFFRELNENGAYSLAKEKVRLNLLTGEKERSGNIYEDLSPAETQFAYTFYGNLWVRNIQRTDSTQITETGKDWSPQWSPDGRKLSYSKSPCEKVRGEYDYQTCGIFVVDIESKEKTRIVLGGNIHEWHPDGKHILSMRFDFDSKLAVSITRIDDQILEHRIILDINHFPRFKYSPDGKKIAYHTYSDGIWLMNSDGSDQTLLIKSDPQPGGDGYFLHPSWHPHKNELVVERFRVTQYFNNERGDGQKYEGYYGLYTIDVDEALASQL